jgi:hypothetical protein
MGSTGKENLAAGPPEETRITIATVPGEKEAQRASEGTQVEAAAVPEPREAAVEGKPEEGGTQQAPGGALGSAWGAKREEPQHQ